MSEQLWRRRAEPDLVDVVGIGQASLDHVCTVDRLPEFASKARMLGYAQLPGGQIATALLACARLGLRVTYLGKVGDDEAGERVLSPLRGAGVEVCGVCRVPGASTQLAVILVDRTSGERTVLWHRDPALALAPEDLSRDAIQRGQVLHLDGGDPEVGAWAARAAREAGMAVVLDADEALPGSHALLAQVDFPIVSRAFAETHFGTRSIRESLRAMVAGGARLAVITLGEGGALAQEGERLIPSPAFPVEARDTTGAGDVFHAGFVWSLLEGLGAGDALRAANAAAALNCRRMGAQGGLPDRRELERFLRETRPGPWRDPDSPAD